MYSVVLLMALSGSAEAPDLGHHKCSGAAACCGGYVVADCGGGYTCCGGYACCGGSCSGSCNGGRHKLFGGGLFGGHHKSSCHGTPACCGGGVVVCCGGYTGCTGSYMGCTGSYMGCTGSYMGCTGSYMGCTGSYMGYPGCAGGMYGPPPGQMEMKPGEKLKEMPKEKKEKEEVSAPATIILSLPADAQVSMDGFVTTSKSATRTFVTPELNPAKEFVYALSARIVRDGQTLTATEQVSVRAGEETRVSLGAEKFTAVTVAAK